MKDFYCNVLENQNLSTSEKTVLVYLNNISNDNKTNISLVDLSQAINITKPTIIKALQSLEAKDYIKISNEGKRYSKNTYEVKNLS